MTVGAFAKRSAVLGVAGLLACDGGQSLLTNDRVPGDPYPSSIGGAGNVVGSAAFASGGLDGSSTASYYPVGIGGTGIVGQGGSATISDSGVETDADSGVPPKLIGAPLIFTPTTSGFGLNAVLAQGVPSQLKASVRKQSSRVWQSPLSPTSPALDLAQWMFSGLEPGQEYEYQVENASDEQAAPLYLGSATTQRESGATFTFGLLTDSHIEPPDAVYTGPGPEQTLRSVASDIGSAHPDFMINMGDMLDFHTAFGFNGAPTDSAYVRGAYMRYRSALGDALGNAAHFPVIGNWEGENGCFTADQIELARSQRLLYVPGPTPDTYPQSGSSAQDYYAFTWGDALFVVLNVMSYTTTVHLLDAGEPGAPDDWTLGEAQMAWLQETLEKANSKWRFLFIHHTVGGAAGDYDNSAYGRGGGQAAHVGEQAVVHQLMQQYGVQIFFYGHDHVFTDMVVDGIHYTLPGSAGAPWKFSSSETGYSSYWTDSGYGRVEVGPTAVDVQFVASGGNVIYEYQIP